MQIGLFPYPFRVVSQNYFAGDILLDGPWRFFLWGQFLIARARACGFSR